jgi:hypothetical protein
MEGNLERRASGAGEIVEMNGFNWDKRKKLPKKVDQEKVKQDREKEKQWRKEESQYKKE